MDRINIKCLIDGREIDLQLDKKAMPGEAGPCYMITENGSFKGYISRQKNGVIKAIGDAYYSEHGLISIESRLQSLIKAS